MPAPVRCESVPTHPTSILDDVCRIYEASIPPSERKSTDALRTMATRSDYRLIAALRDGTVLGFAAVFAPPTEPFALLEYLAVDEPSRGGGIGAALFRAAAASLANPDTMLLVEVEAESGNGAELEHRRRQAFYRRLGCRRITGLKYELPLRTAGEPPAMELMVRPPAAASWRLDRRTVELALRSVYVNVYAQPTDDPRIAHMLVTLADPVGLD
jgi:ribosomal protein S18 acetylase RimI-like enzyme